MIDFYRIIGRISPNRSQRNLVSFRSISISISHPVPKTRRRSLVRLSVGCNVSVLQAVLHRLSR